MTVTRGECPIIQVIPASDDGAAPRQPIVRRQRQRSFHTLVLLVALLATGPDGAGLSAAEREARAAAPLPVLAEARAAGRLKSAYLGTAAAKAPAPTGAATADTSGFKSRVAPVFTTSCVACHGPDKQKGRFRVDTLDPDLLKGGDVGKWLKVFDAVRQGEMPPENDKGIHLDDPQRGAVTTWLEAELQKAERVREGELGASSFRRMTRYEYDFALQDLTGLPYAFADLLPPETASKDGFLNSSPLLQMSGMQFERYRELGLTALRKATVTGARPPTVSYVIALRDLMDRGKEKDSDAKTDTGGKVHLRHLDSGKVVALKDEFKPASTTSATPPAATMPPPSRAVLVFGANQSLKMNLGEVLPAEGIMRVRLRVGRTTLEADDHVALRLVFSAHTSNNANFSEIISARDLPVTAPADQPQMIQFDIPLSEITRNPFRKKGGALGRPDEFLTIQVISNAGNRTGRAAFALHVDHLDIVAPYHEQWPPKSHIGIFTPSAKQGDEKAYGGEVLTRFMTRAWRRPVTTAEVAPYLALLAKYRPGFPTFEEAMLEVLSTVLAAPDFLYLTQKAPAKSPQQVSEFELASRLSFFLWCSIPDQELLTLATRGRLGDAKTLAEQTRRMLAHPRAQRFTRIFVEQWLGLEALGNVAIDAERFKGAYDHALKEAMREEPIALFTEVLRQNRSVMDFIHADYVMVNERLARHYRIPGVHGPDFRAVPVDASINRGGLLTAAGVLTMNSDGKDPHPVKRGVWILNRMLNDPPPPPPPDVPEVDLTDPKILQMSLKERIADHRDKPACFACHAKIDPWGIAQENYDALGSFRTQAENKPVDATATLPNQQPLAGMDGLKRYLLADRQDQFARAMVHKLAAFALGRPLSFGDRADLDRLTARLRAQDDRLGDLIALMTTSDLFRAP